MRKTPRFLVASATHGRADEIVSRLRREGAVAYAAHSAGGCLRVATSVAPDVVLLDPALPARLERLIHAHPVCASAQVMRLSDSSVLAARRALATRSRRVPVAAA